VFDWTNRKQARAPPTGARPEMPRRSIWTQHLRRQTQYWRPQTGRTLDGEPRRWKCYSPSASTADGQVSELLGSRGQGRSRWPARRWV